MHQVSSRPVVGVGIWLIKDGKVLLGERKSPLGKGTWGPPGGHLEFGETPIEGAIRELKEETNLDALELIESIWTNDIFPDHSKHFFSVNIFVTDFSGELKVKEPEKCSQWGWFDLENLPNPLFFCMQKFLEKGSLIEHLKEAQRSFSMRS